MASILERFGAIMSSNINALIEKLEDPEKSIDEDICEMKTSLAEVKKGIFTVQEIEMEALEKLKACDSEIEHYHELAGKALQAGSEEDARVFLTEKVSLKSKRDYLQQSYDKAHSNYQKMTVIYNKLVNDINMLTTKRDTIKTTCSLVEIQETLNNLNDSVNMLHDMEMLNDLEE